MTSDPRAFFAIDLGSATTSAALVGRIDGRWRLLGSLASPSRVTADAVVELLADRVAAAADPLLHREIRGLVPGPAIDWPRLFARSAPPPTVAVIAATEAMRERLVAAASAAGWLVPSASLERDDVPDVLRVGLDRDVTTILAATDDPAAGSERQRVGALRAVVDAIAHRRPETTVVLAGGLALSPSPVEAYPRPGAELLYAPAPDGARDRRKDAPVTGGDGGGDPLRALLTRLREVPDDALAGIARSTETLAEVLGRRVETVAIGFDCGLRVAAWPPTFADTDERPKPTVRAVVVPDAGLVPEVLDDRFVDGVMAWSTVPLDRIRLRDRLRELRLAPWGDPDGDGAALRLAAARSALGRLVAATPEFDAAGAPDLLIATGGVFSAAPAPAVALAIADTVRRAGASGLALDHARLLGPLGSIADVGERRRIIGDLIDDLLVPLGSVVSPQGLHAGRSAGHLTVHAGTGSSDLDMVPGGLQLVDLPPGQVATAEFEFRDPVRLGIRGRRFSIEVGGGLGGLLVDLRDVPLHLPDRLEHRRELLAAWQGALWVGSDE